MIAVEVLQFTTAMNTEPIPSAWRTVGRGAGCPRFAQTESTLKLLGRVTVWHTKSHLPRVHQLCDSKIICRGRGFGP